MSLANKILVTVFVILLIITVCELGYYVYIQLSSEKNTSQTNPTRVVEVPTIIPLKQPLETDASKKDTKTANLLLQGLKKSLDLSQNKILIKSQRTDIYESNIKKIELTGGLKNTVKYDALIALEYKPNEDYVIYLNKNDLGKTKVVTMNNDKASPYNFSSLKSGDHVKIELITNVLEYFDKNTEQITITKFNK